MGATEVSRGGSAELYCELELIKMQLITMIQGAQKLLIEGNVIETDFSEIKFESYEILSSPSIHMELLWDKF